MECPSVRLSFRPYVRHRVRVVEVGTFEGALVAEEIGEVSVATEADILTPAQANSRGDNREV